MDASDYYYDPEGVNISYAIGKALFIYNKVEREEVSFVLEYIIGGTIGGIIGGAVGGAIGGVNLKVIINNTNFNSTNFNSIDFNSGHDR